MAPYRKILKIFFRTGTVVSEEKQKSREIESKVRRSDCKQGRQSSQLDLAPFPQMTCLKRRWDAPKRIKRKGAVFCLALCCRRFQGFQKFT
jgi:hypothetical protein